MYRLHRELTMAIPVRIFLRTDGQYHAEAATSHLNVQGLGDTPEAALAALFRNNSYDRDYGGWYFRGDHLGEGLTSEEFARQVLAQEDGSNQIELEPTANPNLPTME